MESFKSIVVMDLESSGLPSSVGKTKITELSFVGVLVQHIMSCHKTRAKVPRVLQKLNLCFYPHKRIDFEATEITGLDNFMLEDIPVFNEDACALLIGFLERMPSPVCLVAHNGFKFDFPLLKAELSAKSQTFPDSIICADSLMAFRILYPISPSSWCSSQTVPGIHAISPLATPIGGSPNAQGSNSLVRSVSDELQATSSVTGYPNNIANEQESKEMQKANETTPKQLKISTDCPLPLKRKNILTNDENLGIKNGGIRKKLFRGQEKLKSHKLVDLYRYIQGREQDSGHHAENDTLALLECIVSSAPEFLSWVEKNHLSFTKIPCMW